MVAGIIIFLVNVSHVSVDAQAMIVLVDLSLPPAVHPPASGGYGMVLQGGSVSCSIASEKCGQEGLRDRSRRDGRWINGAPDATCQYLSRNGMRDAWCVAGRKGRSKKGTETGVGACLFHSIGAPWLEALGTSLHPFAPTRCLICGLALRNSLGQASLAVLGELRVRNVQPLVR